jgi:regulatory protein
MDPAYDKLMRYALMILSKKRYTTFEMENKLKQFAKKRKFDEALIVRVMERLRELDYLDDAQYAKDYVSDRLKFRPKGKFLLNKELRMKGISKEFIDKAFDEADIDEFEVALQALSKKLNQWSKYPVEKQRNKAYQYLSSRGFKGDAIYKVIDCCYNQ